jgi:hypothetical protein
MPSVRRLTSHAGSVETPPPSPMCIRVNRTGRCISLKTLLICVRSRSTWSGMARSSSRWGNAQALGDGRCRHRIRRRDNGAERNGFGPTPSPATRREPRRPPQRLSPTPGLPPAWRSVGYCFETLGREIGGRPKDGRQEDKKDKIRIEMDGRKTGIRPSIKPPMTRRMGYGISSFCASVVSARTAASSRMTVLI